MEKDKAVEKSVHDEEDADYKKVDHLLECFRGFTMGERVCDVRNALVLLLSEINECYPSECFEKVNIKIHDKRDNELLNSIELLLCGGRESINSIVNSICMFLFKIHKEYLSEAISLGEFFNDLEDKIIEIDQFYAGKEADDE